MRRRRGLRRRGLFLALLVDEQGLAGLGGARTDVRELGEVDLDAPRRVGDAPGEVVTNRSIDDLDQVFWVSTLLEGARVAEGDAQLAVDGAQDLSEPGAASAPVMQGVAAPDAVLADVAAGLVQLDDTVSVPPAGIEDGRGEHQVRHGVPCSEEALREPLGAVGGIVAR